MNPRQSGQLEHSQSFPDILGSQLFCIGLVLTDQIETRKCSGFIQTRSHQYILLSIDRSPYYYDSSIT